MKKDYEEAWAKTRKNILKLCVVCAYVSIYLIGAGRCSQKPNAIEAGKIGLETSVPIGIITAACQIACDRKKKKNR